MEKILKKAIAAAGISIALYAGIGFLAVPAIVEHEAKKNLSQMLGSEPQIENISFNPFIFELAVENLFLSEAGSSVPRLQFAKVAVNLDVWPLLKKEIRLQSVQIVNAEIAMTILKNGQTNWQVADNPNAPEPQAEEASDWILDLKKIQIENSSLQFADLTHRQPLRIPVGPLNLSASNIRTAIGAAASIDSLNLSIGYKGFLKVGGQMSLKPVRADIHFEAGSLPLDFLTAYLSNKTYLAIQRGYFDLSGNLLYGENGVKLTGDAHIRDFILTSTLTQKNAVSWQELNLTGIRLETAPLNFYLQQLELIKPVSGIAIEKNGTLNVKKYLRTDGKSSGTAEVSEKNKETVAQKTSAESVPLKWKIEKLLIRDGKLDFADRQIRPSFAARIDRLSGEIKPLSSSPAEKSNVQLTGRVEDYGKFRAHGQVMPFAKTPDLNLNVNFSNIEMTTFTPYSGKFAGYEIEKGKLFLDLKYTLLRNRIRGQNQVRLDQFTLGDEVESESATGLPLRFALALMQDREGQIRFELPVEGDVNSPSFTLSGLIFTALKNMLINIVAAPFDFIGEMLGGGKDLKAILFAPAQDAMTPEEQQKIVTIAKVLAERPALVIEVQGTYQAQDVQTLKQQYKDSSEEALKKLALRRGQQVQAELIKNSVPPEKVYLLSGTGQRDGEIKPQVQLNLKAQ